MLKVAIATNSLEKINGIKQAIYRFLDMRESKVEFFYKKVESGVSEQPFGEATYQGVKNRVTNIIKEFPHMDFYIGCEAGIETSFGQYFNVQVVCIYESETQNFFWGKSAGWSIPSEDIETIKQYNLDIYLRSMGINNIEELLGKSYSRELAIVEATELALASGRLIKK